MCLIHGIHVQYAGVSITVWASQTTSQNLVGTTMGLTLWASEVVGSRHKKLTLLSLSTILRATALYAIARRPIYATPIPSVCHTRVYCIKTAESIIEILLPSNRHIILVFVTKGRFVNLTTSPPTLAPNTRG